MVRVKGQSESNVECGRTVTEKNYQSQFCDPCDHSWMYGAFNSNSSDYIPRIAHSDMRTNGL